jgi:hypothetical protein
MDACSQCPHPHDCMKVGACLDDINARYLATGRSRFPQLMSPAQATALMGRLRGGESMRRITGGGELGKAICSPGKVKKHCAAYPEWGTEVTRLARVNSKAANSLKGSGKRARTHCGRGHEFAVHGLGYKNHVNGKRYRYCKLCNKINSQQGGTLPSDVVEKIKTLVRAGNPVRSFTAGGQPGYLARFNSVKLLRSRDAELDRLVRLNFERRIVERRIITSNVRLPTLTGRIAAQPVETFSAADAAVSHRLPRHIRDDVMGRLILDLLEGRVDVSQAAKYAQMYTRQAYNQMNYGPLSLDARLFEDGPTTRGDRVTHGLWD